jgi:hypothetical protein
MSLATDHRGLVFAEYDLRRRATRGDHSHYRIWMTIELLGSRGALMGRYQTRGDFERQVTSVDPIAERIVWRNVGSRGWDTDKDAYGEHQPLDWAEGFAYDFSPEQAYEELAWDHSHLPKTTEGYTFVTLQITGHLEFDFLRSARHGRIDALRRPGDTQVPPEDGQRFQIEFPPLSVHSALERRHVRTGFLGLTEADGELCAILDYRQGPQTFTWENLSDPSAPTAHEVRSWQYGQFVVRTSDGELTEGDFTERAVMTMRPLNGGQAMTMPVRGMYAIRRISTEEFAEGLDSWGAEQTPRPPSRRGRSPLWGVALPAVAQDGYRVTVTRTDMDRSGHAGDRTQWRGSVVDGAWSGTELRRAEGDDGEWGPCLPVQDPQELTSAWNVLVEMIGGVAAGLDQVGGVTSAILGDAEARLEVLALSRLSDTPCVVVELRCDSGQYGLLFVRVEDGVLEAASATSRNDTEEGSTLAVWEIERSDVVLSAHDALHPGRVYDR